MFCPNEGGAFKQTSTGQWAHLLCAMFIPEVTVGNTMFMEPIDNVDKVPKSRWKLVSTQCDNHEPSLGVENHIDMFALQDQARRLYSV